MKKIEYINLGLPSGTLWATHNAHIGKKHHFTYDEAIKQFGDCMPDRYQYKELLILCKWKWIKLFGGKVQGYRVTGPNHNSIFLPASGCHIDTSLRYHGSYGYYWSSRSYDSSGACLFFFGSGGHSIDYLSRSYGFPIRLVKR